MAYIELGTRSHKRATLGISLGSMITFAIMYSPQPLISVFSAEYGVSPATASLSVSLTTFGLAGALFFIAIITNVFSRKGLMCFSLIVSSSLTLLSAFMTDFTLFLGFRLLIGIVVAGFPSVAMAYLYEEFSPEDLGKVIGYYVSGTALGGLSGRIIVGALSDFMSFHLAFAIQGILSLAVSIWFLVSLPPSKNHVQKKISRKEWFAGITAAFGSKGLVPVYLVGFLIMGSYISILNYIGYPLTSEPYNLSQTLFGFLFVVNLFGSYSSVLFGKLADRYPRPLVMSVALGVIALGVGATLHPWLIFKIAGVAAVAFGLFAGHSVASGWTGILAPKEYKGQASAFYLLFYYAGSSILGWAGGLFFRQYDWLGLTLYIFTLLSLTLGITFLFLRNRE